MRKVSGSRKHKPKPSRSTWCVCKGALCSRGQTEWADFSQCRAQITRCRQEMGRIDGEPCGEDLRSKDIGEAEESIKFLETQREKTRILSLDEVFAQLIEEQTKTIMLANVSKDYVFDVIDPPVASELKSKPSRRLICVVGTLLGGMFGVVLVLIGYFRERNGSSLA